jgi:hypothetical protein
MSEKIVFSFKRGGALEAFLLPELNPITVGAIKKMLPLQATVYHSRWSGREINFPVKSGIAIPRENQTAQTNTGDVIYWKEWEKEGTDAAEALALYYGPEVTRDHRGYLPVNVFARIPQARWKDIEEIGLRIWQHGIEQVEVRIR